MVTLSIPFKNYPGMYTVNTYNELAHNATTYDYKILNDAVRIRPKSLHEGNNYQTGIRTAGADHFFQHCTTRGIEKPVL